MTIAPPTPRVSVDLAAAYRTAFLDWLACASAGAGERAAVAARAGGSDLLAGVTFAGTAGHVLDFDDTFPEGLAHLSAATAPAALVLAAHLRRSLGDALRAYAAGFEAMAAVAQASHPALYDAGWHPTAVCGPVGAAVAAARLLELTAAQRQNAVTIALLRAGGARGAFGSDGKALQVGLAAAAGVQAALLARAGASVGRAALDGPLGFTAVTGARWPWTAEDGADDCAAPPDGAAPPHGAAPAILRNWIKLHPSCLGTHAPIDAAAELAGATVPESLEVAVHPLARQAAHLDAVRDGLAAKFSIPYCVASTLLHGPPGRPDFTAVDETVLARARDVHVIVDDTLPEFGAVLSAEGQELARAACPRGAPARPITERELAAKIADLAGPRLWSALDDLAAPAADVLLTAGLGVIA